MCETRLPHDSHGCIDGSLIDWKKAHNVRNFTHASINHHSACVWECKVFILITHNCLLWIKNFNFKILGNMFSQFKSNVYRIIIPELCSA